MSFSYLRRSVKGFFFSTSLTVLNEGQVRLQRE
jgi:hypothetical protein